METIGFLALGALFVLVLSLMFGGQAVEGRGPTSPVQVIIQPAPEPMPESGSGTLVISVLAVLLLLIVIMMQAP